MATKTVDIVIYGNTMQGFAAALKAKATAPNKSVMIINPTGYGAVATIGGQNYWDCRLAKAETYEKYQMGTFADLFGKYKKFYNTDTMYSNLLMKLVAANVSVEYSDITSVTTSGGKITSVKYRIIEKDNETGFEKWAEDAAIDTVYASVFIDASEDGRLTRLADPNSVISGRADWPADKIPNADEKRGNGEARQQAASLMFKVKGVQPTNAEGSNTDFIEAEDGVWGADAHYQTYQTSSKLIAFNNKYKSQGFMLKPFNAAQNGPQTNKTTAEKEWWVNMLVVYNVDGRARERDRGTSVFPSVTFGKTVDQAYVDAKAFIKAHMSEINECLREWNGFTNASIAVESGEPKVGKMLYLRETCHMSITNKGSAREDNDFYVAPWESISAGDGPNSGSDTQNYADRIGIIWYNPDIHPYQPSDVMDGSTYIWGYDGFRKLRGDYVPAGNSSPAHPMYFPYKGLLANTITNLLIPGYACNCCSFSWGEVRVLPNMCVLGDAAGVAAGYCVTNGKQPKNLTSADIAKVQDGLRLVGARLEKTVPFIDNRLMALYDNQGATTARNSLGSKSILADTARGRNLALRGTFQFNGTTDGWVNNALRFNVKVADYTETYTLPDNIHAVEMIIKRSKETTENKDAEQKPFTCATTDDTTLEVTKGFTFGQDWTPQTTTFTLSYKGKRFVYVNNSGKYPFDEVLHVVVSFDTNTKKFSAYINGELIGEVYAPEHIPNNQFRIGAMALNREGYWGCFNGDIYRVRIYNAPLESVEVGEHYAADKPFIDSL